MRVAVIVKGDLHASAHYHKAYQSLREALPGFRFTHLKSKVPGQAIALARGAATNNDYLIAVGGDGTVNEVANGALQSGVDLPTLGILAYGTANDLVRTLGLRGDVDELVTLLASDRRQAIDVGSIRYRDAEGSEQSRYFLNAADIGIGAEVVRHLNNRQRFVGSNLHYLRSIIASLRAYQHRELSVRSNTGLDWRGRSLALVAGNGRYFGSGLCVAPGARLDDGELFVTLVGDASTWDFMRNLSRLKRGTPLNHPEVHYYQARSLTVEHRDQVAPVEVDGELLGYTPVQIDLIPRRLEILMPALA